MGISHCTGTPPEIGPRAAFGALGAVTVALTSPRKHFTRQVKEVGLQAYSGLPKKTKKKRSCTPCPYTLPTWPSLLAVALSLVLVAPVGQL